ncbi:hypothetical protein [Actinoplanes sp. M2I2]|uniref:hypothetical protein n=1 Tax=Actinoplanes sp. M2I2 TaxID=1734444 RepID=UPI0020205263|nr:hypothetical protein [Actinoplanes sp. M2I2]
MRRMFWRPSAALVMAVALLAACGDTEPASDAPAAAPAPSAPASAPASGASNSFELVTGTAKTNEAAAGTGDWALMNGGAPVGDQITVSERWVQLTAGKVGDLGRGVTNGAGLTLYRFDKDSADPSRSTCNDDCAKTWPPVTVDEDGRAFLAGLKKSAVTFIRRDDGRIQATVGGWPVYRFAQDAKAGQTKGQGVGGTWFAVSPTGEKLAGGEQPAEQGNQGNGQQADDVAPAKSAFLFSQPDFSDTAATQGVKGGECQDVALSVKSISADGRFFVWDKKGCKGQRRQFGDEGVANLADFDTKSIRLR